MTVVPEGGSASTAQVSGPSLNTELVELLKACSLGEEAAFAKLYDATAALLFGLVLRTVRDRAQAEEVTQDACLHIWQTSSRFDPDRGSALSWLMTIGHRKAVDRVRSAEATRRRDTAYEARDQPAPFDQTAEEATVTWMHSGLANLSAAAGELAAGTPASPPASLRASVLHQIGAVRPLPPLVVPEEETDPDPVAAWASSAPLAPTSLDVKRAARDRRARPLRQLLASAAAAAVLATGGLVWHPWPSGTSNPQLTAMQQLLQAKDAQRFEKTIGGATATVVRSPSLNKAVIAVANLPDPPGGKVYELWLQHGTTMVKAGFLPNGSPNTVLLQGDAATAAGAGITIEPTGGSPTPTLPPVALIALA